MLSIPHLGLEHVALEVSDLFSMELFYRKVFGFRPLYRYLSRNTPGLRTAFLERDGVRLELLERPRAPGWSARGAGHFALEVDDVDGARARVAALGLQGFSLSVPRDTGDGYREVELIDPEGNRVELTKRLRPGPMPPIRAAIFDLDGTLLDTEENYYQADRLLLEERGIPFSREDKRRYVGGSSLDMMEDSQAALRLPRIGRGARGGEEPELPRARGRRHPRLPRDGASVGGDGCAGAQARLRVRLLAPRD